MLNSAPSTVAQRRVFTMLATHAGRAVAIAEQEVADLVAANDVDEALLMDQVRREILSISLSRTILAHSARRLSYPFGSQQTFQ